MMTLIFIPFGMIKKKRKGQLFCLVSASNYMDSLSLKRRINLIQVFTPNSLPVKFSLCFSLEIYNICITYMRYVDIHECIYI